MGLEMAAASSNGVAASWLAGVWLVVVV